MLGKNIFAKKGEMKYFGGDERPKPIKKNIWV